MKEIPKPWGPEEYVRVWIKVERCKYCDLRMVHYPKPRDETFPKQSGINFKGQAEILGLVKASGTAVDHKPICQGCVDAGKVDFLCSLCNKRKPSSKIQESFGCQPQEHLCADCYRTVPAKLWEAKIDALQEKHKYDWD